MYYKLLAHSMPALSPAMGRPGEVLVEGIAYDDMSGKQDRWGRRHFEYGNRWIHSDVKDMAYFYVKTLFDKFVLIINGEQS